MNVLTGVDKEGNFAVSFVHFALALFEPSKIFKTKLLKNLMANPSSNYVGIDDKPEKSCYFLSKILNKRQKNKKQQVIFSHKDNLLFQY